MFGNFFNSLTGGGQQNNEQAAQNSGGQQPQQPQQGGGDNFLSGLMNVAQEVGKAIGDKTQEGAQAVKSGAGAAADTTKSTAEGAGRLTKEQMDQIASGISSLVGKAADAFSQNKGDVEEQVTAVDAHGGKIQISSVSDGTNTSTTVTNKPEGGNDFLAGLMGVAKQVGQAIGDKTHEGTEAVKSGASTVADTTKSTAEGAGKLTKEQMDQIAAGISSLVGKAAGAFSQSKGENEEQITAVDSKGGKVQISSVSDGTTTATAVTANKSAEGGDFLSGLIDVAKQVGQVIGEKTQEGAGAVKSGAQNAADTTKSTAEGAAKTTKEDLDKITAGIGDLIGKAAGALHIGEKKEGSPTGEIKAEDAKKPEGNDLLSGLVGLAKDITKKIEDNPNAKKEDNFEDSKPTIDDVEGEIGKVITTGYTAEKAVTPTDKSDGFFSNVVERTKDIINEGVETAGSAVEKTVDTVKEGAGKVLDGATEVGGSVKEGVSSAAEVVVDGTKTLASNVKDEASSVVDWTKEGVGSVADKTMEIGGGIKDSAVSAGESVKDGVVSVADLTKEGAITGVNTVQDGAGYVVDGANTMGDTIKSGATTVVDAGESGVNTVVDGAKGFGLAVADGASTVADTTKDGAGYLVDKTKEFGGVMKDGAVGAAGLVKDGTVGAVELIKEGAGVIVDGTKNVGSAVKDGTSTVFDAVKSGTETIVDKTSSFGGAVVDGTAGAVNSVKGGVGYVVDKTKAGISGTVEFTKDGAGAVADGAKSVTSSVVDTVSTAAETVIDKTKEFGGAVKGGAVSAVDTVADGAKSLGSAVKDGAASAVDTVADGAKSLGSAVKDGSLNTVNSVKDGAGYVVDKTKDFGGAAKDGAVGAAGLVKDGADVIVDGVKEVGSTVKHGAEAAMDKTIEFGGAVRDGASSVVQGTVEGATQLGGAVKDTTISALESVKDKAASIGGTVRDEFAAGLGKVKQIGGKLIGGLEGGKEKGAAVETPVEKVLTSETPSDGPPNAEEKETFSNPLEDAREATDVYKDFDDAAVDSVCGSRAEADEVDESLKSGGSTVMDTMKTRDGTVAEVVSGEKMLTDLTKMVTGSTKEESEEVKSNDQDVNDEETQSMKDLEESIGSGIMYQSALDVGNVLLSGAATLIGAIKEGTEVLIESELESANEISEDVMYGPNRESRSKSPSRELSDSIQRNEVIDSDNNPAGSVNYGQYAMSEEINSATSEHSIASSDLHLSPLEHRSREPSGTPATDIPTLPASICPVKTINDSFELMPDSPSYKKIFQVNAEEKTSGTSQSDSGDDFDFVKDCAKMEGAHKDHLRHRSRLPGCESGGSASKSRIPVRINCLDEEKKVLKPCSDSEEEGEIIQRRTLASPIRGIRSRSPSVNSAKCVTSNIGGVEETNMLMDVVIERQPASSGASASYCPRMFYKE